MLPLVGLCVRHVAPYLPEPIGVELSDEGGPPAMPVCPGDDLGGEAAGVEDDEGPPVLRPAADLRRTAYDDGVRLRKVSALDVDTFT